MSLEYGEYYVISGYFSFPYQSDNIFKFLQFLDQHGTINGLSFYKTMPSTLTYNSIMDGLLEEKKAEKFDCEDFLLYSFIEAEISFAAGSSAGLSVSFWDSHSYNVLLLLSQEDIDNGVMKPSFLNGLAIAFFDILRPAFGHMDVEEDVGGFEGIKDGSEFSTPVSYFII